MKVKCEYCDNYIQDTEEICPNCGAPNSRMIRSGIGVPKTIEQLLAFCREHHLPLEQARFFIGIDYQEPRAFGIYQDEAGEFVVYKNKADGTRVIRYRGSDEAYAVNEIYQKLKSEVLLRKSAGAGKKQNGHMWRSFFKGLGGLLLIAVVVVGLLAILVAGTPDNGYYRYQDANYYYNMGSWYRFDDVRQQWQPETAVDEALSDHYADYWEGEAHRGSETTDFTQSEYYSVTDEQDWSDDWDDDGFDWDSGSDWDSSDTDWDSDW